MAQPRFWLAVLAWIAFQALVGAVVIFCLDASLGSLGKTLLHLFFAGVTGVWFIWFQRRGCQLYLREQLNAHGLRICLKCGYDLTGNESGVCPECGDPWDPILIAAGNEDHAD